MANINLKIVWQISFLFYYLCFSPVSFAQDIPAQVEDVFCNTKGLSSIYGATKKSDTAVLQDISHFVIVANQSSANLKSRTRFVLDKEKTTLTKLFDLFTKDTISKMKSFLGNCKPGPLPLTIDEGEILPNERLFVQLRLVPQSVKYYLAGNEILDNPFPTDCEKIEDVVVDEFSGNFIAEAYNVPAQIRENIFILHVSENEEGQIVSGLHCFDNRTLWLE